MTNPGTTHMSHRSDLSKKNDRNCFGKNNNNKIDRKRFEKTSTFFNFALTNPGSAQRTQNVMSRCPDFLDVKLTQNV